MADAPKKAASKGKGIGTKLGPLPYWGWALVGGGTFLTYRFLRARSAASAAAGTSAAQGLTGGTLIPNDIGLPSGTANAQATFSTVAGWQEALLQFLTGNGMSPGDAFSAAEGYLGGTCVSQAAYNGLAAAFISPNVGLPPGFTSPPPLSVCPQIQQTPTPSQPNPQPSGGGAVATALAQIDAGAWPSIIKFGQDANAATDFTQIGVVNNGVYSGKAAKAGAPVWAGEYGGYAQGFNMSTLPNGTIIYGASTLDKQGYYA
jgi:hypothetical protein